MSLKERVLSDDFANRQLPSGLVSGILRPFRNIKYLFTKEGSKATQFYDKKRNSILILAFIAFVANIFDGFTTFIGLNFANGYEMNPVARYMFSEIGFWPSFFWIKIPLVTMALLFHIYMFIKTKANLWALQIMVVYCLLVAVVTMNLIYLLIYIFGVG